MVWQWLRALAIIEARGLFDQAREAVKTILCGLSVGEAKERLLKCKYQVCSCRNRVDINGMSGR
jgi:hypothetical protein